MFILFCIVRLSSTNSVVEKNNVANVKREVATLLSLLPRLKRVVFHLRQHLDLRFQGRWHLAQWINTSAITNAYFQDGHTSLAVHVELAVRHELYSPYQAPGWVPSMAADQQNWIEYRGVKSEDPQEWRGVDLQVVSVGMFTEADLQEAKSRAAEAVAARAREAHRRAQETRFWQSYLSFAL